MSLVFAGILSWSRRHHRLRSIHDQPSNQRPCLEQQFSSLLLLLGRRLRCPLEPDLNLKDLALFQVEVSRCPERAAFPIPIGLWFVRRPVLIKFREAKCAVP